ncbi:hypothetical protein BZA05DRAFT_95939 [Tricharina praecox]|uniref:uncharacterized protein n=1 Tax=Tricharina praecox TaxID=43433 RepID=UPI00222050B6|nr:uncharacterized protein BZA05DRAFT_95939 [Tricharina praecox]KAI5848373.1 hypothetical protein BZA05DRAFT_95939 [Tricharina praecox]
MATPEPRRYEPEELLALAKSPLVKKPSTLPPMEEWMGPVTARPTASRARTDGDIAGNSNGNDDSPRGAMTNRRPSIFSDSRLSRSSIPEDMVLGPPKMSFASSSARTSAGNKFDHESVRSASINTPTFDDERGESPRFERFKSFGGFGRGEERDKEAGGRDFSDLRGGFSKRREDSEGGGGWTNVSRQPRKSFGAEEGGDRERFRKDMRGDADKKGGSPWDRERPAKYENFGKERDREHRGRGKRDESSWLLEDNRGERNNRDNPRDHHRFGSRVEKDPEWMDSDGKSGDGKAAHSMEDFQKWKERMKASSGGSTEPHKKPEDLIEKPVKEPEHVPEPTPTPRIEEKQVKAENPKRQESNPRDDAEGGVFLDRVANERHEPEPPHAAENGVDRFFGFWSGNSILKSPEQGDIISAPRAEPRAVGKSRFTSFFGPQESHSPPPHIQPKEHHPTPVNRTPPYTQSPVRDSGDIEDREGFQRILKMLGTTNINGPGPSDSLSAGLLSRPPQSSISPGIPSMSSPHPPPPQAQHGHQQYPMPSPGRDSNTDFLMRLMRGEQPQQLQQQQQQQQQHQSGPMHNKYGGPSQMPPPPPIDTSILQFNRGNHNPISPNIDDPAVMFRHRPNQDSPIVNRGPPHMMDHHGPPPGWNPQQASQAPPPQSHRQVAPPPGFAGARHQQGPPPPFMAPPGVNGPPVPFQLLNGLNGPLPPNMPPPPHFLMGGMNGMGGINGINGMNGGPPPLPSNMNGPPQGGFPGMPFPPHHHPDAMLGGIHGGPPFGFPHHDSLKSQPFGHGPNKGIMR